MKVKNKVSGEIIEMTEILYERNKKFFTKVIEKNPSKKVDKKKKKSYNKKETKEVVEATEDNIRETD